MAEKSNFSRRDEEDEEEEEVDEGDYKTVKDAVLFAIDVSESMLRKPEASDSKKADRDNATTAALKCAYSLMQQRIISNPNDMMGIVLFGTEQSKFQGEDPNSRGGLAYPHIYLLADLDVPDAEDVKTLKQLVEDKEEAARLLVPSSEKSFNLANLLFCANQIFTMKAPNFSSRRLFLVTDNDNPHFANKDARNSAAVRARDLYDLGVKIELFPISTPTHQFNRSTFYDDIVYESTPSDPDAPAPMSSAAKPSASGDGITLLQSLLSSINSKAVPRRALFSNLPLELGPGLRISVKGYIVLKRQEPARSTYIYMQGEKPQIAVGKTNVIAGDTARHMETTEIKKAFNFGGEQIVFTKDELAALRNFGDPVIRIIGFKPLSMLPIWAATKPATFIYPSDEEYVGSTRVFSALQQKLVKAQRYALVWFIARRNAAPMVAALLPGKEEVNEEGAQVWPPGLWIHPLPFADDIRQNPDMGDVVRASDELVDYMHDIVRNLQLPKAHYDPKRYPNPALQWHYRVLQAIALDEDMPEKAEDHTIPRYKQIHKRVGDLVVEWGQALDQEYAAHAAKSDSSKKLVAGLKRAAGIPGDGPSKKAKLLAAAGQGVGDDEMRKAFEKSAIDKFKVQDLKDWLYGKKLSTTGKKADLVERVTEFYESK
ncbi:putative DSB repair complex subunit Ku70 [Viridothelium virens]|uniref:ATP-dependent DNA helicase II subunit 1 n=1 Tax=Viridothelium virens TaxID=1048519 RepID=A0A6A6H3Q3_VIRVR|nr:putative DSB repair complex subunit Ku70 [Viridothelium virens]